MQENEAKVTRHVARPAKSFLLPDVKARPALGSIGNTLTERNPVGKVSAGAMWLKASFYDTLLS